MFQLFLQFPSPRLWHLFSFVVLSALCSPFLELFDLYELIMLNWEFHVWVFCRDFLSKKCNGHTSSAHTLYFPCFMLATPFSGVFFWVFALKPPNSQQWTWHGHHWAQQHESQGLTKPGKNETALSWCLEINARGNRVPPLLLDCLLVECLCLYLGKYVIDILHEYSMLQQDILQRW